MVHGYARYCHVPAGWGLQQTTLAPGSDKTRGEGSFGPLTCVRTKGLTDRVSSWPGAMTVLRRPRLASTRQYNLRIFTAEIKKDK